MNEMVRQCLWQQAQLGGALKELARAAGVPGPIQSVDKMRGEASDLNFEDWLDASLLQLGLETDVASLSYGEAENFLQHARPAILEYTDSQNKGFIVLLRKSWHKIILLKPDGSTYKVSPQELGELLFEEQRESIGSEIGALLEFADIRGSNRARTFNALLTERGKNKWVRKIWRLRLNPGSDFWAQIRYAGVISLLLGFFVSHSVTYGVYLLFWKVLGNAVFANTNHWQTAWLLTGLILALVPLRLIAPWLYGALSIRIGELLKRRLLYGALLLEPEEIRHQGTGQFLGRVIETEAIETSAMRGSGNIFMSLIQLAVIIPFLAAGAGGRFQVILSCLWLVLTLVVGWRYFSARVSWTHARLNLTNDLVEQLLGYRTRLAQQPRPEWHLQEERLLAEYDRFSTVMDHRNAWLKAALPYGWMLAGLLVLLPSLMISSTAIDKLALTISGVIFGFLSFQQLTEGITQFSDARVAWDQVKLMFDAATRSKHLAEDNIAGTLPTERSLALLTAENLQFRYGRRSDAILNECSLSVKTGDRILLLGPSGCGKSTLAAILSGLRVPQHGALTLGGRTEKEIGERLWRKRIVAAPQFHENHIFTETFAFNLLLGRRWPPTLDDLQKAKKICVALGLDKLLKEMPGGMFQFVGETGWQLSHGEKSRVYIARALLQGADIIILDESFSALDAGSLRQSLECVVQHAPTLVVIAHP